MEENSVCEKCRTWEVDIYWKHFSSMHFFLFLPHDFHQHLVLPTKFSENMMYKLPKKVSLIGPSAAVWDVELKKTSNVEFGGDGWKAFVKAYDLKEHNLLMFKYRQNSSFEVLILDQESFCEKEASYFVKQCKHVTDVSENGKKRRITEAFSMETIQDQGSDDDDDDDDDDNHDDPEFVIVKKKSKSGNAEGSGIKKNPQTPRKVVYTATPRGRGRPKMVGVPCTQTPRGRGKPKMMEESQSKSKTQSEKEPKENGVAHDTVEKDHEENGAANNENGAVHDSVEKGPKENGASVENGAANNELEREPEENGASEELSHVLEKEQNTLDNGGEVVQTPQSEKSTEKKTSPKKQVSVKSSRKRVCQRDSAQKYSKEYKSNRRPVTEAEIENARISGLKRVTENSFLAVMKPNNVHKRFYLHFPLSWLKTHRLHRNCEAVLRIGEKTWLVFFYHAGERSGSGFTHGWKKFALDNMLEESDACLFKLASHKDEPDIVFDVEIFRVVPEVVPPGPVAPTTTT